MDRTPTSMAMHQPAADPSLNIQALRRHLQARTPQYRVRLVETHISWVLLCGPVAYKLKKPVRLGFLDFSTAQARRHACDEELRLNRRFAPALYIDVVPVCGTAAAPTLAGTDPAIDHAVRMHRLAAGSLFSERLAAGRLAPTHVDRLAQRMAEFHRNASAAPAASGFGTPAAIEAATNQVLAGFAARGQPVAATAALRSWLAHQAAELRPIWEARRSAGWVREGHGDLHLANAAVHNGEAIAFDCIEFDPALRWIDVMSDAAFMVMDLMAHGRRDLGFRFLDAWLERTGDHAGLAVLRYYLVYRALVRALVTALRPPQRGRRRLAPDYPAVAHALTAAGDARLMITHGVSGSGKTFVSQQLLEQAGAIRVRSDVERKRLFGLDPLQQSASFVPEGIYGPDATERTFAALRERAAAALRAGYPTLVDATFLLRSERMKFVALAAELQVPFTILHCHAPVDRLRRRIAARQAAQCDASEAGLEVLQRQTILQEPLDEAEQRHVIDVDTADGIDVDALCARWRKAAPPCRERPSTKLRGCGRNASG